MKRLRPGGLLSPSAGVPAWGLPVFSCRLLGLISPLVIAGKPTDRLWPGAWPHHHAV